MTIRTFIAAPIPRTPSLEAIRHQLGVLRPAMKLIASDQQHITLAFLGDTDESLIPPLTAILQDVAKTESAVELTLRGLGAFPRHAHLTVVWVGFADGGPLIRMADVLAAKCESLGFAREARPFQPHLTMARIKSHPPRSLAPLIRDHSQTDFGLVSISHLELFRSDLLPQGPVYTSLASVPLCHAP